MSLASVAEEYFSKLNSIANRLHSDIKETKVAYEDLWNNLPPEDQEQILSDSIIKPELCLRYTASATHSSDDINGFARKLIIDDNCSYRDEHSGPFSFKTASQMNLTIFEKDTKPVPRVMKAPVAAPLQKEKSLYTPELYTSKCLEESVANNSTENTLPKTGLDFLDNW